MSGAGTEEIQLEVADDIVSGTEAVTNDMQSPAEGTGAQSLPAAVQSLPAAAQSLPAAAQSLPAAAQGDEDRDQFSHGSLQVVAQSDMDQFSDGSFQVCDGHQIRRLRLLYRSGSEPARGMYGSDLPAAALFADGSLQVYGSEPASGGSEPAGGGSGGSGASMRSLGSSQNSGQSEDVGRRRQGFGP